MLYHKRRFRGGGRGGKEAFLELELGGVVEVGFIMAYAKQLDVWVWHLKTCQM